MGQEDTLWEGMATHSTAGCLENAWRIPWTEEPWGNKELDMTEQQTLSPSQHSPRLLLTLPLSRVTSDGPAQGWAAITPTCAAAGPPSGALRPVWTRSHLLFKTFFPWLLGQDYFDQTS